MKKNNNDDKYANIKKMEYGESYDLIDVLDNLIYLKEVVYCNAYADFNGVRYDNMDLDSLKKLREIVSKPSLDENLKNCKPENKRKLLNCLMARKSSNESVQYWVNQAKSTLDQSLEDDFEYQCYHYLSIDNNNYYTIKYACYFLYVLQTKGLENAKEVLDQIMLNVNNRFDYTIFKDLTLNYTNYVGFLNNTFEKLIPPIDKDEELEKIKRLIKD